MKNITEITRRYIYDLFRYGYDYYGSLTEIDFLKRLYPLEEMLSLDTRFENAASDIWQHTVNNDDYPSCWIFEDERFPLKNGSDEDILRFLCEIFHPAVRYEKGYWKDYLGKINTLLKADGYELYESDKISNRSVYLWRQTISTGMAVISNVEKSAFLKLFNRGGWVLNFSTNDFDIFTMESIGIALCEKYQISKGKSLSAFANKSDDGSIIKLFSDLIEYYEIHYSDEMESENSEYFSIYKKCRAIIDRFSSGVSSIVVSAEKLKEKFSSEYISAQIDLMIKMQKENPTEAIGKAKELIESCCKTILENKSVLPDKNWTIVQLVDETTKLLKVTPKDIPDTTPEIAAIKAILGNLKAIAQNVANLRNSYGSGHGKSSKFKGLEERHAKLAIGSSITLVNFLWDSHERKIN